MINSVSLTAVRFTIEEDVAEFVEEDDDQSILGIFWKVLDEEESADDNLIGARGPARSHLPFGGEPHVDAVFANRIQRIPDFREIGFTVLKGGGEIVFGKIFSPL